jgi:hypothetical protein
MFEREIVHAAFNPGHESSPDADRGGPAIAIPRHTMAGGALFMRMVTRGMRQPVGAWRRGACTRVPIRRFGREPIERDQSDDGFICLE